MQKFIVPVLVAAIAGFAMPADAKKKNKHGARGYPPGLAKQCKVPPGHAKKNWDFGDVLPAHCRYQLSNRALSRLPQTLYDDRQWVRTADDAYLVIEATGVIVDVLQDWFN